MRDYLGRDGRQVTIEHGVATVEGEPARHGLTNIAQVCHQSPPEDWPRLVARHLGLSDIPKLTAAVEGIAGSDFEQVAGQLAIRIHPEEFLTPAQRPHIVHRTDLDGTLTVLVLDIGPTTLAVPVPIADGWAVPAATMFDRALQNVSKARVQWMSLPLPPDGSTSIDALVGDPFYTASHILRTDAHLPRTGRFGNLFGVPNRSSLISHPLDGLPVWPAVEAMLGMTTGMFHDGPGSITPHLFWRTPSGRFLRQQGCKDQGRIRLAPSPEFLELLERLQQAPP
ncbi:MAG: hypothetical protein WBO45_14610 [Planctomycetota bacterium]